MKIRIVKKFVWPIDAPPRVQTLGTVSTAVAVVITKVTFYPNAS